MTTPLPPQGGPQQPARYNSQPLPESERAELARLRKEKLDLELRLAHKQAWWPGIPLHEDAESLRDEFEADYAVDLATEARREHLRREVRRRLDADGRQPVVLVPAAEVWAEPDPPWLVGGWIPETGVGALFGPSGTWKSFVALHLLTCVVFGLGFFGQPVNRPGFCIYLLGEGQAGAGRRLRSAVSDLPVPGGPPQNLA